MPLAERGRQFRGWSREELPCWAVARLVTRMSGSVQSRLFCSMQKRELTVRGIGEFGDLDHL